MIKGSLPPTQMDKQISASSSPGRELRSRGETRGRAEGSIQSAGIGLNACGSGMRSGIRRAVPTCSL